MRVIVVGAGEVGTHIAQLLSREGHDVTVVDSNRRRVKEIDKLLDVSLVHGSATDPEAMREAGVGRADLLVAATSQDEVNLVASLIAKLEGVKHRIVRLESAGLRGSAARELHRAVGANLVIDPDDAVARAVLDLLSFPGATEIARLAEGKLLMLAATLREKAPFANMALSDIAAKYDGDWDFIVCTLTRDGKTIVPRSEHSLEVGDDVRIVCRAEAQEDVRVQLGLKGGEHHRVMIMGGGRTGEILARQLVRKDHVVAIIDRDPERAQELAEALPGALILLGDITDAAMLTEEDVGSYDAVVALTGEDDSNILACLFAKRSGASETIAVLHRLELQHLLRDAGVDVAISPRTASANEVLRIVRGGTSAVATSLGDDIEFYEVEVAHGSDVEGRQIKNLKLPRHTLIASIVRDGTAQIGRGHCELEAGDHVVFVAHAKYVDDVSRRFTGG